MPDRDPTDLLHAALTVPDTVAVREVDDELVLLDFETETYFGLDAIGARMWGALVASPTVADAVAALLPELDVDGARLRVDVVELVGQLVEAGLLAVAPR